MWPSHMTERGRRHGRRGAREFRAVLADGSTRHADAGLACRRPIGHSDSSSGRGGISLELRQLTYFVAVAEEGSFTRASERLYIAQPAVSRQVGHLERELGARLFARRPDGVRLTRAGEALLPRARRMLATADECRDTVAAVAGLMRGRLIVGSLFAAPRLGLPQLLAAYHDRHPDVDIVFREEATERLLQ